jgi:Fur family transcriptional regulator, ferric uptake regulator
MPPSAGSLWAEETLTSLRRKGHRDGGARRAVIQLLGKQACCLTAQEIFDQLREQDRQVGIASIYRTLEQLTREGYLQRIEIGADSARFEPVLPHGEHHHHLVCDDCGKIEAFADEELERALNKLERRTGYTVGGHDVLLHGACSDCAPARARLRAPA